MEFKLENIDPSKGVSIHLRKLKSDEVFVILRHNDIEYNSLFDDILYIFGSVVRKLQFEEMEEWLTGLYLRNEKGTRLTITNFTSDIYMNTGYILNRNSSNCIYIREHERKIN